MFLIWNWESKPPTIRYTIFLLWKKAVQFLERAGATRKQNALGKETRLIRGQKRNRSQLLEVPCVLEKVFFPYFVYWKTGLILNLFTVKYESRVLQFKKREGGLLSLYLLLYMCISIPTYTKRNTHWEICYREDASFVLCTLWCRDNWHLSKQAETVQCSLG